MERPVKTKAKPYKHKVTLTTTAGDIHIVMLTGPEPAVRKVAELCALGLEADAAGIKRGEIAKMEHKVTRELGRIIQPN